MKQRKLTATNFFLLGMHQHACWPNQNPPKSVLNQLKLTLFVTFCYGNSSFQRQTKIALITNCLSGNKHFILNSGPQLLTKYIRKTNHKGTNHKATNLLQWVVSPQSRLYSSLPVKIRIQQLLKLFPIQAFWGCIKIKRQRKWKKECVQTEYMNFCCCCTATDLRIRLYVFQTPLTMKK